MAHVWKRFTGTALLVSAFAVLSTLMSCDAAPQSGKAASANGLYAPQWSRSVEFLGNPNGFTDRQIELIARNVGYFTISQNADDNDMSAKFEDARRIVSAA